MNRIDWDQAVSGQFSFKWIQRLQNGAWYPWMIVSVSALYITYRAMVQVSPGVMTDELMRHFHLSAVGLSNMAAGFYYVGILAGFFAGPLLDRYSPCHVSFIAILLLGLSVYGFSQVEQFSLAFIFRMLMGVGSAFAIANYYKLTAIWFSDR